MSLLLDTCVFLWLTLTPEKLSQKATAVISDPMNKVFLSTVSAWEIAIKYGKGQLLLDDPPRIFVPKKCTEQNIEILPLDLPSALRTNDLPSIHYDPFDRILICQALTSDFTLVTSDSAIQKYAVKTIW